MTQHLTAEEWAAKITQATPGQLILIQYELILQYLNLAKESDDLKDYKSHLEMARKFLHELTLGLDFQYEISETLYILYLHVNKLIAFASVGTTKKDYLTEAEDILKPLLEAFSTAVSGEGQEMEPVVENAQKIYTGLTYGKHALHESVVDSKGNGLKA